MLPKVLGLNWRSNLIAIVAFLGTVPSIITAINQFINHQQVDWHAAAGGLLLSVLAFVSKDASNKSTIAQAEAAQAQVAAVTPEQKAAADAQVKLADSQVMAKK